MYLVSAPPRWTGWPECRKPPSPHTHASHTFCCLILPSSLHNPLLSRMVATLHSPLRSAADLPSAPPRALLQDRHLMNSVRCSVCAETHTADASVDCLPPPLHVTLHSSSSSAACRPDGNSKWTPWMMFKGLLHAAAKHVNRATDTDTQLMPPSHTPHPPTPFSRCLSS